MLNEFLFTNIEEEDIDNIWFQQDQVLGTVQSYIWRRKNNNSQVLKRCNGKEDDNDSDQ